MLIRKTQQPSDYPSNSIHDSYSTATTDTYSCNFINGTILYENDSGSNGNITLIDSSANYRYIDIYYRNNDNYFDFVRISSPNNKKVSLNSIQIDDSYVRTKAGVYQFVNSNLNFLYGCDWNIVANAGDKGSNTKVTYITKIIGYK